MFLMYTHSPYEEEGEALTLCSLYLTGERAQVTVDWSVDDHEKALSGVARVRLGRDGREERRVILFQKV